VTIFHAQVLDTPEDPFRGGELRADSDVGIRVVDGVITERAAFAQVRGVHRTDEVVDVTSGVLLPGLVDTHVHFPQLRVIGALGMPLLDWLHQCALPEEARFADVTYARAVAGEFVAALVDAGTTSALVFGAHFAGAVDTLFEAAAEAGLRVTSGLVVADRELRPELHTTADKAYEDGRALACRWHGTELARYAVTPRFALATTDDLLASCAALHKDIPGSLVTTHINENLAEVDEVRRMCGGYLETYDRHGLLDPNTVLAHNVHPTDAELDRLAASDATVAHCPASNAALGSGMFPFDRHSSRGIRVALGTDIGAGTGPSLFKEALQAFFTQQQRGADGVQLTPAHLLHLATTAGADALGMRDEIGELSAGKRFDAVWIRPPDDTTLEVALRHADGPGDALAKLFALATPRDVARVWVDGREIGRRGGHC
jgi:guanine deaminase